MPKNNKPNNNGRQRRQGQGKDFDQKQQNREKNCGQQDGGKKPSEINDVNWYTVSKQVLDDSAALPFSYPIGGDLPGATCKIPGIMRIVYEPAITYSDDAFSAINQASMKFYSFIRQANSGAKNYESADLMIYFMAVASIYSLVAAAKRAYGCLKKFSNYNKYLGASLLRSCGVSDVDGLRANSADFRRRLNIAIANINSVFHIPKGLSYIERSAFMNSVIVSDAPGKKFQLYVPFQNSYWKYDATWNTGGRLLGTNTEEDYGVTYNSYLDQLDDLIAALMGDEDVNIMSGDILKAYGDANCYKLAELDQDYDTPILFDLGFLSQIHNARCVLVDGTPQDVGNSSIAFVCIDAAGSVTNEEHSIIFQKDGMLRCEPVLISPQGIKQPYLNLAGSDGYILDIPVENPTPGDVMESTRLVNVIGKIAGTNMRAIICGSEVIMRFEVYFDPSKTEFYNFSSQFTLGYVGAMTSTLASISNFDYHPILSAIDSTSDGDHFGAQWYFGDTSTFTSMSRQFVQNIHESAAYGLFKIPALTVTRGR